MRRTLRTRAERGLGANNALVLSIRRPLEEVAGVDAGNLSELKEPAGADPVGGWQVR
jgi:hypothetical protein